MWRASAEICLLLLLGVTSAEIYNVSQLVDDQLSSLSDAVTSSGDVTVRLAQLESGGWKLSNARLADMTTLTRAGDCWMWNVERTVFINGTLGLGAMFLTAESALNPKETIVEPIITVSENKFDFLLEIELDTEASCHSKYSITWTLLRGVRLYPGYGVPKGYDLTELVNDDFEGIGTQLSTALGTLLTSYGNMCESRWLNRMEMIKYNIDHEYMSSKINTLKESEFFRYS